MKLSNVWLTSDPHYFHVRALEIMPDRPWKTVDEMNEGLAENHNNSVKKEDVVIFLGDVVMGPKFETVPKIIPRLNGTKILVRGNHDAGFGEFKPERVEKAISLYKTNGMSEVYDGLVNLNSLLKTLGVSEELPFEINMCHFPTITVPDHPDQYEQRYKELHPTLKEGEYLLCGHTHSRQHLLKSNVYHVGVDAEIHNYRPVELSVILNRLGIA